MPDIDRRAESSSSLNTLFTLDESAGPANAETIPKTPPPLASDQTLPAPVGIARDSAIRQAATPNSHHCQAHYPPCSIQKQRRQMSEAQ